MNDLQQINLRELTTQYLDQNKQARDAVRMLDARLNDETYLPELLRNHLDRGIYDENEVYLRDSVDDLLSFYSLIEIACLVHFVPAELPSDFTSPTLTHLSNPSMRVYYENHYPQLLPKQLRRRLEGKHRLTDEQTNDGPALFMQLLNINDVVERDKDVEQFLYFLDDYINDYSWIDLRNVISNPYQFLNHMTVEPEYQTYLDRGIHGFRKFLIFCHQFDTFLEQLDQLPLLRSAAWHYHAYWFDHLHDKIGDVLDVAIGQFMELAKLSDTDEDSLTSRHGIDHLRQVLGRLLHSPYRETLILADTEDE